MRFAGSGFASDGRADPVAVSGRAPSQPYTPATACAPGKTVGAAGTGSTQVELGQRHAHGARAGHVQRYKRTDGPTRTSTPRPRHPAPATPTSRRRSGDPCASRLAAGGLIRHDLYRRERCPPPPNPRRFILNNGNSVASAEATLSSQRSTEGRSYLNIHTTTFSNGEIRGFLFPIPEPGTAGLVALGIAGMSLSTRRRR